MNKTKSFSLFEKFFGDFFFCSPSIHPRTVTQMLFYQMLIKIIESKTFADESKEMKWSETFTQSQKCRIVNEKHHNWHVRMMDYWTPTVLNIWSQSSGPEELEFIFNFIPLFHRYSLLMKLRGNQYLVDAEMEIEGKLE